MTFAFFAGLAAGLLHVFSGPDHLAAVAPLAADSERSLHVQRSCHQKLCRTATSTATAVAGTYGQSTTMVSTASVAS